MRLIDRDPLSRTLVLAVLPAAPLAAVVLDTVLDTVLDAVGDAVPVLFV